nr:Bro-N domain-containing protein [Pseudomonas lactis]
MGGAKRESELPIANGRNRVLADVSKEAARADGSSLKRRSPDEVRVVRASGNEINFEEEIVMSDISTAASNVIPFKFGKQQVRTLLIDDQPWFVAVDVSSALEYRIAGDMTRNLDEDEKGTQIVRTPGGAQEMLVINESGLYSAILRSRKAEAKRFKKWVTTEVLPAIRKHGRYEDHGKMATLMDELIGMSELNVIKGLIRDKSKVVPADQRQGFQLVMHNRLHTRFNVPRTELIPAAQFDQACNFIGSYALEGEYIQAQTNSDGIRLDQFETASLYMLMSRFVTMEKHKSSMLAASRALGSSALMDFFDQLHDGHISFSVLDKRRDEIYAAYKATGCEGGYVWRAAA